MTTKNKKQEPFPVEYGEHTGDAPETSQDLVIAPEGFSSMDQLDEIMSRSENLEALETKVIATAETFSFVKEGEKIRGIFAGFGEMSFKDKASGDLRVLKCVRIISNRQIRINAGANLVGQFDGFIPVGTAVEIEYTGLSSDTKTYRVSLLG